MFEELADDALLGVIGDSARAENAACARRLAAIAELYRRRQVPAEDGQERELWRVDPWDAVAAEISAAQCVTPWAAGSLLHDAVCLHDRLPAVAAVFATGAITYRTVRLIITRTLLALDADALAAIDADISEAISTSGPMSTHRTQLMIDEIVERHDPEGRRRANSQARGGTSTSITGGARPTCPVSCTRQTARYWIGA